MRKIEDVLVGFVATMFFCLNMYLFAQVYIYGEQLSLWTITYRSVLTILSVLIVVGSFLAGRKNDETDPWAEEKKENGRIAYFSFVFCVIFVYVSVAAFTDLAWPAGIMFLVGAVVFLVFGAISIETMNSYIKAILPKELTKLIRKEVADYIEIDKMAIKFRKYGEGYKAIVTKGDKEFEVVFEEDSPDDTWFTTTGRTVKLFKIDQWVIVLCDHPIRVRVFESKVHPI